MKILFLLLFWISYNPFTFANDDCLSSLKRVLTVRFWTAENKAKAHDIMLAASDNLSRTISDGRRYMAPQNIDEAHISTIAAKNFERTVRYLINKLDKLEINQKTAIRINKMLTKDLVPDQIRGKVDFRRLSPNRILSDDFVNGSYYRFYKWLESDEAKAYHKSNPVEFAEKIHHNIVALDSFPDGNGRLSRLLADLALMKQNLSPAFYTSRTDYFARGNALSDVSRKSMRDYFYEIVQRGRSAMNGELDIIEQ